MLTAVLNSNTFKQGLYVVGAILVALIAAQILPMEVLAQNSDILPPSQVPDLLQNQNTDGVSFFLGIVNFILRLIGIVAVAFIIYAGILYMTDAGGGENLEKAKKIILYSIVGLVVIFASYAIVNFAIDLGQAGGENTSSGAVTTPQTF